MMRVMTLGCNIINPKIESNYIWSKQFHLSLSPLPMEYQTNIELCYWVYSLSIKLYILWVCKRRMTTWYWFQGLETRLSRFKTFRIIATICKYTLRIVLRFKGISIMNNSTNTFCSRTQTWRSYKCLFRDANWIIWKLDSLFGSILLVFSPFLMIMIRKWRNWLNWEGVIRSSIRNCKLMNQKGRPRRWSEILSFRSSKNRSNPLRMLCGAIISR